MKSRGDGVVCQRLEPDSRLWYLVLVGLELVFSERVKQDLPAFMVRRTDGDPPVSLAKVVVCRIHAFAVHQVGSPGEGMLLVHDVDVGEKSSAKPFIETGGGGHGMPLSAARAHAFLYSPTLSRSSWAIWP